MNPFPRKMHKLIGCIRVEAIQSQMEGDRGGSDEEGKAGRQTARGFPDSFPSCHMAVLVSLGSSDGAAKAAQPIWLLVISL